MRLALINLGHRDSLNLYSWCLCPGDGWEEKMPGFCSAHRSNPAQASISTWTTGFHSADRACSLQSLRQDKQPRPPINTPTRGVPCLLQHGTVAPPWLQPCFCSCHCLSLRDTTLSRSLRDTTLSRSLRDTTFSRPLGILGLQRPEGPAEHAGVEGS